MSVGIGSNIRHTNHTVLGVVWAKYLDLSTANSDDHPTGSFDDADRFVVSLQGNAGSGNTKTVTLSSLKAHFTPSAGDGLDLIDTTLSLDLKANGGLVIESTEVAVDLGASSITGTLAIADGGTGATTASAAATNLGLGVSNTPTFADLTLNDATATLTLAASSNKTFTINSTTSDTLTIVDSAGPSVRLTIAADGTVTIPGNLSVGGSETITGSTTNLVVTDPHMTLGSNASDDNKDRGVKLKYHTGTEAKIAWFGLDDDDSYYFKYITDASFSSDVVSGTLGDMKATNFRGSLVGGTVSGTTGTFTGAVSGTTGTFSSTVSGVAGTFSGALSGAGVSSTAGIAAATFVTASAGDITATDGDIVVTANDHSVKTTTIESPDTQNLVLKENSGKGITIADDTGATTINAKTTIVPSDPTGASAHENADVFVIKSNDTHSGMSLLSADEKTTHIFLGSATESIGGAIDYLYSPGGSGIKMSIGTSVTDGITVLKGGNSTSAMHIHDSQKVVFGPDTAAAGLVNVDDTTSTVQVQDGTASTSLKVKNTQGNDGSAGEAGFILSNETAHEWSLYNSSIAYDGGHRNVLKIGHTDSGTPTGSLTFSENAYINIGSDYPVNKIDTVVNSTTPSNFGFRVRAGGSTDAMGFYIGMTDSDSVGEASWDGLIGHNMKANSNGVAHIAHANSNQGYRGLRFRASTLDDGTGNARVGGLNFYASNASVSEGAISNYDTGADVFRITDDGKVGIGAGYDNYDSYLHIKGAVGGGRDSHIKLTHDGDNIGVDQISADFKFSHPISGPTLEITCANEADENEKGHIILDPGADGMVQVKGRFVGSSTNLFRVENSVVGDVPFTIDPINDTTANLLEVRRTAASATTTPVFVNSAGELKLTTPLGQEDGGTGATALGALAFVDTIDPTIFDSNTLYQFGKLEIYGGNNNPAFMYFTNDQAADDGDSWRIGSNDDTGKNIFQIDGRTADGGGDVTTDTFTDIFTLDRYTTAGTTYLKLTAPDINSTSGKATAIFRAVTQGYTHDLQGISAGDGFTFRSGADTTISTEICALKYNAITLNQPVTASAGITSTDAHNTFGTFQGDMNAGNIDDVDIGVTTPGVGQFSQLFIKTAGSPNRGEIELDTGVSGIRKLQISLSGSNRELNLGGNLTINPGASIYIQGGTLVTNGTIALNQSLETTDSPQFSTATLTSYMYWNRSSLGTDAESVYDLLKAKDSQGESHPIKWIAETSHERGPYFPQGLVLGSYSSTDISKDVKIQAIDDGLSNTTPLELLTFRSLYNNGAGPGYYLLGRVYGSLKTDGGLFHAPEKVITYAGHLANSVINWYDGNNQSIEANNSIFFEFTNNPPSDVTANLKIKITWAANNKSIFSMPASIKWSSDTAMQAGGVNSPETSNSTNDIDIISLYWDGTNYYGSIEKGF